jgi:hypothetical protein
MDKEFNYQVPTVYHSEGHTSMILNHKGEPFIFKPKQKLGFDLKPKKINNGT